jgi:hypothetical protein
MAVQTIFPPPPDDLAGVVVAGAVEVVVVVVVVVLLDTDVIVNDCVLNAGGVMDRWPT